MVALSFRQDGRSTAGVSCSEYSKRYDEAFQALEEIAEQLGTLQEGPECDACLRNFIAKLKQSNLAIKQALDPKVQQEHETYGGEGVARFKDDALQAVFGEAEEVQNNGWNELPEIRLLQSRATTAQSEQPL